MNVDSPFFRRYQEVMEECDLHLRRIGFAQDRIHKHFPLTVESMELLSEEDISYLDQFVFRTGKLQDVMGRRLFTCVVELFGIETQDAPLIDKLRALERLQVLNEDEWMRLRALRNELTHEYANADEKRALVLNRLWETTDRMRGICERIKKRVSGSFS